MSYKISKELFEAVMNVKLTTDLSIAPYYNEVNGCEEEDLILINYNFIWIPLDTFFFKCKEWAYNNRYKIDSHIHFVNNRIIGVSSITLKDNTTKFYQSNSEQQAVFDACMYILDKDKQ